MSQEEYSQLLNEVYDSWRPTPRRVVSILIQRPSAGLIKTADAMDAGVVRLEQVEPPLILELEHRELIAAARASAGEARSIAASSPKAGRRELLEALRAAPGFIRLQQAQTALEAVTDVE
jgi:hypothetical protein